MRTRLASALAAAFLIAGALPAAADDSMPGTPPTAAPEPAPVSGKFFDAYDTNQDGKVTKLEYLNEKGDEEVFGLLDKNGDGMVLLEEVGLPADYEPKPLPKPPEAGRGAPGGPGRGEGRKRVEELLAMDVDKDGRITREEYKGKRPFDALDQNKDGVLSRDDFRPRARGGDEAMNPEQRFKERDKNGDGKITSDEMPDAARFQELDKDGDGAVTAAEMRAAGKGKGKGGGKGALRGDKNGDGKVARDEFPGSDDAFRALDKNADGAITADELPKGARAGKDAPPRAPGEAPQTPGSGGGLFAALDKDGDGRLARNEFSGDDAAWRRMDRNADGWITPDEAR